MVSDRAGVKAFFFCITLTVMPIIKAPEQA